MTGAGGKLGEYRVAKQHDKPTSKLSSSYWKALRCFVPSYAILDDLVIYLKVTSEFLSVAVCDLTSLTLLLLLRIL